METIERKYTYDFFYMVGVLLMLVFSAGMNAGANESVLNTFSYHPRLVGQSHDLTPIFDPQAAYCQVDADEKGHSKQNSCQKVEQSQYKSSGETLWWKSQRDLLPELSGRGTKYVE